MLTITIPWLEPPDPMREPLEVTLNQVKYHLVDQKSYEEMAKAKRNAEYLAMLEKSRDEIRRGKVVVKTMEELEAMANE